MLPLSCEHKSRSLLCLRMFRIYCIDYSLALVIILFNCYSYTSTSCYRYLPLTSAMYLNNLISIIDGSTKLPTLAYSLASKFHSSRG
jgi:hypothetical protein